METRITTILILQLMRQRLINHCHLGSYAQIKPGITILILRLTDLGEVNHGHLELAHVVWATLTTLAVR